MIEFVLKTTLLFVGGALVLLITPILYMSAKFKWKVHGLFGKIFYLIGCIPATTGGSLYVLLEGTSGGVIMDLSFIMYGMGFFLAATQAIINRKQVMMILVVFPNLFFRSKLTNTGQRKH